MAWQSLEALKTPGCTGCGLAVEWVRRAYSSEWHLWPDFPDVKTKGRYVRVPPGTPCLDRLHPYGSRNWTKGQWQPVATVGEDFASKQPWHSGKTPFPYPLPRDLAKDSKCGAPANYRIEISPSVPGFPPPLKYTVTGPVARFEWEGGPTCGEAGQEGWRRLLWFVAVAGLPLAAPLRVRIRGSMPTDQPDSFFLTFGNVDVSEEIFSPGFTGPCTSQQFDQQTQGFHTLGQDTFSGEIKWNVHSNSAGGWVELTFETDPPLRDNGVSLVNGFDARCYRRPLIPAVRQFPDISLRHDVSLLADVVNQAYLDIDAARDILEIALGDGWTYTTDPVTGALSSGSVIARSDLGTVACLTGTTDFWNLAVQIGYAGIGPYPYAEFSTNPLWYHFANAIQAKLLAAGVQPGERILLVGHSAGGAAAAVLAGLYRVANADREIDVLTFGCPRPGDVRLRNILKQINLRHIANDGDPIPGVPPRGDEIWPLSLIVPALLVNQWNKTASHISQWQLTENGELIETDESTMNVSDALLFAAAWVANLPIDPFASHAMAEYLARLNLQ